MERISLTKVLVLVLIALASGAPQQTRHVRQAKAQNAAGDSAQVIQQTSPIQMSSAHAAHFMQQQNAMNAARNLADHRGQLPFSIRLTNGIGNALQATELDFGGRHLSGVPLPLRTFRDQASPAQFSQSGPVMLSQPNSIPSMQVVPVQVAPSTPLDAPVQPNMVVPVQTPMVAPVQPPVVAPVQPPVVVPAQPPVVTPVQPPVVAPVQPQKAAPVQLVRNPTPIFVIPSQQAISPATSSTPAHVKPHASTVAKNTPQLPFVVLNVADLFNTNTAPRTSTPNRDLPYIIIVPTSNSQTLAPTPAKKG